MIDEMDDLTSRPREGLERDPDVVGSLRRFSVT
jgi:hypothetical protein